MKNRLFTIAAMSLFFGASAQVGINIGQGQATLDVVGFPSNSSKMDGIIAPRLTETELNKKTYGAAQTGALVYVTLADLAPAGQTTNVSASGYYYFDGSAWVKVSSGNSAGTVTGFSSGNLSPLFTTTVTNPSTNPALAFNLTNAPANTIFGNSTASAAAPSYFSASSLPLNGDVTGTLGSTTVVKINGSPLGTTTTATNGQILTFNGTNWIPSTPAPQSADWRIDGNSDITATGISSSVGGAASGIKYLGTQNANDLVLVANGTIRGVIDNTNGTLTGGGTDGDSYLSWGSQNSVTKQGSNFTFNNAIIAGFKNTLINSNGITATGKTATAILGRENSVTYHGVAIGYANKVNGAVAIGYSNDAASGFAIGSNNKFGSGSYLVFGRDFNASVAPNNGLVSNSNVYSSEYHYFQSQDTAGAAKFSKVAINTLPTATQLADVKVSKAVQFVNDASLPCDVTTEGSIRYNSSATAGNFQGCRRTSGTAFAWTQLN